MTDLTNLMQNNRAWAENITREDPEFFNKLSQQQSPEYLWIGCSDSRVPANEIVGLLPGELFVHRNVANVVIHTDLNCLSVLQYAVEVLKVKHIIVTGHYGCGGVRAALGQEDLGLIDNWLRVIRDIYYKHQERFKMLTDEDARADLLCELNVIEQVGNVCHTNIVQNAWNRGQQLSVHGWIYSVKDGIVKDLGVRVDGAEQIPKAYHVGADDS
ncbi:carbonate dehydratase [Aestuariirhabdus sp. Z084]|uniref:carbonate dehydratase n=1 Tax=Aestuariirhabdus haliotis TaxID=2918751 RepID=UPI00201B3BE3|nr:carbonate dehydratase [Aestuariirhabdus haliotis]MCL6417417.1 carbonate dehydratase [Aestuariirhabdus haliotis]MCL6421361.1 carbonate dehydratase [Aestuariirhabdus haliotis]